MKLGDPVSTLPLVGPFYESKLKKLDISSIEDLLHHVPSRYLDFRNTQNISSVSPSDIVTIKGSVKSIINQYTRSGKKIQIAQIVDNSGKITAVWFNQPFLIRTIKKDQELSLAGEIGWFGRNIAIVSPEYEQRDAKIHTERLIPIYPETARLSSKWLRGKINYAHKAVGGQIKEHLPDKITKKYNLYKLPKAIKSVHFPQDLKSAGLARRRLAFDELLVFHLTSLKRKRLWEKHKVVYDLSVENDNVNNFIESLPFTLTKSQTKAVDEILSDLKRDIPMNRLLEGDVGSGKTVIAAVCCLVSFLNGHQAVIMAPTQILAEQHYQTLKTVFSKYKLRIALVTSAGVKADLGKSDIFIGTHALIHKKADFDKVALVVIDEQHRFGVKQRAKLVKDVKGKRKAPHVLTMTATPIPRTIALTAYGDLNLSTLDELPKGRAPITTWIVPKKKRLSAYDWIKSEINEKKAQVFVVCPLIEESDKELMQQVKAATKEYERLSKIFNNHKVDLLHGRLKIVEKNKILSKFKQGKTDILVSTPVVEVGIDIPNATIMVIEAADRFGLAQLHQLRGRVGRGSKKSYCMLFTDNPSKKVSARLLAMKRETSGFKLAEIDLKLRGPGEIFGIKQHGFPELKIASWQDIRLIKNTKLVAQDAIDNPKVYQKLHKRLKAYEIAPN